MNERERRLEELRQRVAQNRESGLLASPVSQAPATPAPAAPAAVPQAPTSLSAADIDWLEEAKREGAKFKLASELMDMRHNRMSTDEYLAKSAYSGLGSSFSGLEDAGRLALARTMQNAIKSTNADSAIGKAYNNTVAPAVNTLIDGWEGAQREVDQAVENAVKNNEPILFGAGSPGTSTLLKSAAKAAGQLALSPFAALANLVAQTSAKDRAEKSGITTTEQLARVRDHALGNNYTSDLLGLDELNQNLAENRVNRPWLVNAAADVAQTGANMLPSIGASLVTQNPDIGLAMMSLGAGGNQAREALDYGADIPHAEDALLSAAAIEYLTGKMFGGLPALGGEGVVPKAIESALPRGAQNAINRFAGTKAGRLAGWAGNKVGEGVEEVISELARPSIEAGYKEQEDIAPVTGRDLLTSGGLGAFMALLFGGGPNTNTNQTTRNTQAQAGNNVGAASNPLVDMIDKTVASQSERVPDVSSSEGAVSDGFYGELSNLLSGLGLDEGRPGDSGSSEIDLDALLADMANLDGPYQNLNPQQQAAALTAINAGAPSVAESSIQNLTGPQRDAALAAIASAAPAATGAQQQVESTAPAISKEDKAFVNRILKDPAFKAWLRGKTTQEALRKNPALAKERHEQFLASLNADAETTRAELTPQQQAAAEAAVGNAGSANGLLDELQANVDTQSLTPQQRAAAGAAIANQTQPAKQAPAQKESGGRERKSLPTVSTEEAATAVDAMTAQAAKQEGYTKNGVFSPTLAVRNKEFVETLTKNGKDTKWFRTVDKEVSQKLWDKYWDTKATMDTEENPTPPTPEQPKKSNSVFVVDDIKEKFGMEKNASSTTTEAPSASTKSWDSMKKNKNFRKWMDEKGYDAADWKDNPEEWQKVLREYQGFQAFSNELTDGDLEEGGAGFAFYLNVDPEEILEYATPVDYEEYLKRMREVGPKQLSDRQWELLDLLDGESVKKKQMTVPPSILNKKK